MGLGWDQTHDPWIGNRDSLPIALWIPAFFLIFQPKHVAYRRTVSRDNLVDKKIMILSTETESEKPKPMCHDR